MALSTELVQADGYDRDAWLRARKALGKSLDDLVTRGDRLMPAFGSLVEDLFRALFKLVVRLVPRAQAPRSSALARRILEKLLESPAYAQLKEESALDLVKAAEGAMILARRVHALLQSGEILLEDELLAAQRLARLERKMAEKRDALTEAEQADRDDLGERLKAELEAMGEARDELGESVDAALKELPDRFDKELDQTTEGLAERIETLEQQSKDFAQSVGAPAPADATARLELAEKLRNAAKLEQLARLAGAFRAEARAARKKHRERASEELYRVGRGRELAHVLPVELSALRDPRRRLDFMRRLVEGDLAAYDLRGSDRHGRGPLVICVDGSGSMSGERELWSKGLTLALLEIVRRQKRRARALVFSGAEAPLHDFELTATARSQRGQVDLAKVVALAECFPGGGTDFEKPLRAAAAIVAESRYRHGDIVFVTDGEAQLSAPFVEELQRLKKEREIAVYAVVVDDPRSKNTLVGAPPPRSVEELKKVADEVTTVSRLTTASVRGLFERL